VMRHSAENEEHIEPEFRAEVKKGCCECGHARLSHDIFHRKCIGKCMAPGCNCKFWRRPIPAKKV
jgi:hypothetical protein